jgi:hypothetical protein
VGYVGVAHDRIFELHRIEPELAQAPSTSSSSTPSGTIRSLTAKCYGAAQYALISQNLGQNSDLLGVERAGTHVLCKNLEHGLHQNH